jgi:arylsulfatase A-like enzyme
MRRFVVAAVVAVVVVLAIAAAALALRWRTPASGPAVVAVDLAERLPFARRSDSERLILVGAPESEKHLVTGFGGDPERRGRELFQWVRQGASLRVTLEAPGDREIILDIEAYAGTGDQSLTLHAGTTLLGSQPVPATRSRIRFEWPASAQSAGENTLAMTFARAVVPARAGGASGDTRDLAAALFSVAIPAADRKNEALLIRDAPRAYQAFENAGVPGIVLPGGSATEFAFEAPENGVLALEAEADPWSLSSGGSGALRIDLDTDEGTKSLGTLHLTRAAGRSAFTAPIDVPARSPALLRFSVASEPPRLTFARVTAPRILGRVDGRTPPTTTTTAASPAGGAVPRPPNVLLVVFDAARARDFGAYGDPRGVTPNVDRLAREGVVFESAYTTAAYTLAAMSSVWTSQQPDRHHGDVAFSAKLPRDRLTLAEVLSAQGVHAAGWVANAVAGAFNGFDRGFAEFEDVWKRGSSEADVFRAVAPGFLDRMKAKGAPFFAYVHYREPHHPYDPRAPWDVKFGPEGPIAKPLRSGKRAEAWTKEINQGRRSPTDREVAHLRSLYAGNLGFADAEFGWLREQFESRGLWSNTVVIVIGDHGEALFERGYIGHNTQVYEESARIPLIVAGPAMPAGARLDGLVDLTDVAPTILEVFGLAGAGGSSRSFQGESLLGVVRTNGGKRAVLTRTVWARPVYGLRTRDLTFLYNSATTATEFLGRPSRANEAVASVKVGGVRAETMRQELLAWVAALRRGAVQADATAGMTREQCENLKSLNYVGGDVVCPK